MTLFSLFPNASYMSFYYNDHTGLHLLRFIQQILSACNMPVTLLNAGDITMSKNKSANTELLHNLDRGDKLRKLLSKYILFIAMEETK